MVAVLGGAFALLALAPEAARAADGPPTKRVSYADLNLRSPAGQETLARRVKLAARQVCERANSPSVMPQARRDRCVRQALADAMSQVDHAIVLAEMSR